MKTAVSLYVIGIDPVVKWKTTSIPDIFKGKDSSSFLEKKIFFKAQFSHSLPFSRHCLLFA